MNIYNIKHHIYSIGQSSLLIFPITRAKVIGATWRTWKNVLTPTTLKLSLIATPFKLTEQELSVYFPDVKWSGLNGGWVSVGLMEMDPLCHIPESWSFFCIRPAGRQFLSSEFHTTCEKAEKVRSRTWADCSSHSPLSSSPFLSFTLSRLHFGVKCY